MCVVRFANSTTWLAAVRQWKDQAVEPWAYLELRSSRDLDELRWVMWVQGSLAVGASLWLFQETLGHCHESDAEGWDCLTERSKVRLAAIRASLSEVGIPAIRASVDEEYKPNG
jgi:hypothetical protein